MTLCFLKKIYRHLENLFIITLLYFIVHDLFLHLILFKNINTIIIWWVTKCLNCYQNPFQWYFQKNVKKFKFQIIVYVKQNIWKPIWRVNFHLIFDFPLILEQYNGFHSVINSIYFSSVYWQLQYILIYATLQDTVSSFL